MSTNYISLDVNDSLNKRGFIAVACISLLSSHYVKMRKDHLVPKILSDEQMLWINDNNVSLR